MIGYYLLKRDEEVETHVELFSCLSCHIHRSMVFVQHSCNKISGSWLTNVSTDIVA